VKGPSVTISIDDSNSQVPFSAPSFYPDLEEKVDSYVISNLACDRSALRRLTTNSR
jgi:hypothetical protein